MLLTLSVSAGDFKGSWRAETAGAGRRPVGNNDGSGTEGIRIEFPSSALIYKEAERNSFRPSAEDFNCSYIEMEVLADGAKLPLKAWMFVKEKDGLWFQSGKEFRIVPGEWTLLRVRTDISGREFFPVGHNAPWSAFYAATVFAAGVSICGDDSQAAIVSCRNLRFGGERQRKKLDVTSWNISQSVPANRMFESRFELSRDYFNPFDTDEIAVDFEVETVLPGGVRETVRYPAFFGMDYSRSIHFTREKVQPQGKPYWAFRFTPQAVGDYRVRLSVTDMTSGKAETFLTDWKEFRAVPSDSRGFIRKSPKNPFYFEFSEGGFFYGIGMNLHTNTDQRSEEAFKLGHLPDRGLYDYDEYIDSCAAAGMNLLEVWMSAWTFALEWTSSRNGYYGLGRYNMANAWKLDRLLERADSKGIYVNIVLDNHGKITEICDPEWYDSPFNTKGNFAVANGAVLDAPDKLWTDEKVRAFNSKRNRYIAARWGAATNVFAFEFWSEVDLSANGRKNYESGDMVKWHSDAADELAKMDQGRHFMTTHVCSDIDSTVAWRNITMDLPQFQVVVSDGYRDGRIIMPDQMRKHMGKLGNIAKPALITEYGGTSGHGGGEYPLIIGDIHGGIWASLFARQAATPLLWWHDFVHFKNHYGHYRAFAEYMKGIDLLHGKVTCSELSVTAPSHAEKMLPPPPVKTMGAKMENPLSWFRKASDYAVLNKIFDGMALYQDSETVYGWVYNRGRIYMYPSDMEKIPDNVDVMAVISPGKLERGAYTVLFYDTLTGKVCSSAFFMNGRRGPLKIEIPPFKTDVAFKILKMGQGGGRAK